MNLEVFYPEACSEPNPTSRIKIFCEFSERLKAIIYFCKKNSIVDVWLGSNYASAINQFYDMAHSFKDQHNKS